MAFEIRLDRLELTNFHQFEQYIVDFDEHLTVLVGDNGAGKSSVLDAACVALGTFFFSLAYSEQRLIDRSDARIAAHELGEALDFQGQYPVSVYAEGLMGERGSTNKISWSRSLASSDGKTTYSEANNMINAAGQLLERVQNGDASLVLPLIAYYGTDRLWAGGKGFGDNRRQAFTRLDGYKGALDARVSSDQMLTWFFKMTASDVQRAQSYAREGESPLFAAVRKAVEDCFKSIAGRDRVRVTYSFDADDLEIEYVDPDDTVHRMPMNSLSDGYRTTLSMVADIAYRMAILNPQLGSDVLDTSGVVLIDEVDLHLHPLWQARILGDLRRTFPNIQFIVTTHAPVVISSVRARHIRVLDGGIEAKRLNTEIYGSDTGRVLLSVMGAPERPREVQGFLDTFYDVLDDGDFDRSHQLLDELEREIGRDDTAFVGAQTALALEEADAHYVAN
ncbi:AAA family ATPase [Collinsella tanakaei]|nr:AAA family ATPase [Collinsella tanakaei]